MPRNVRNFWMDGQVDGRRGFLQSGPRGAGGGLRVVFQQRDRGQVTMGVKVHCYHDGDGALVTQVWSAEGSLVYEHRTVR